MAENLVKRGSVYYVRVAAPKRLRELRTQLALSGQSDVWRSLGTKDPAIAKRALPAALEAIYAAFEAEESRLLASGARDSVVRTKPTGHDLERASWVFVQEELRLDELARIHRPTSAEVERQLEAASGDLAINPPRTDLERVARLANVSRLVHASDLGAERRHALAEELKAHLANNTTVLVDWAVDDLAQKNHWLIEKGSVEHKTLARHLMRAWLTALRTTFQRDEGLYEPAADVIAMPVSATLAPSAAIDPRSLKPKRGESLRDHFDSYLREQKAHAKPNTLRDARATVRQFIECNGDRPIETYTKADMAQFKRLLLKSPARVEKLYPGVPLPKAVERNQRDGHPLLRSNSVRNKLSTLAAFGKWLEENFSGIDCANFATTLPKNNDSERMEPFSADEVRSILNAKAFTGCLSEQNQVQSGAVRIRDWRFWLPLIAAFTGARLNEITQLEVTDLVCIDGVWAFNVTDEGKGQSLKNENSRRLVPVHPTLMDLGLLSLQQRAIEKGQSALFHEIPLYRDGRRSHHAGKWFRKFLVRIGVKVEGSLGGMHRWRHTLTDALRRAGVDDYQIAQVLGHKLDVAKMTGHYGREVVMTLKQRHGLLARVEYPSVDFSALR